MEEWEKRRKDKNERILDIYSRLLAGKVINKAEEAAKYKVNERSIQRDIDDIRSHLDKSLIENGKICRVVYDRRLGGYQLEEES